MGIRVLGKWISALAWIQLYAYRYSDSDGILWWHGYNGYNISDGKKQRVLDNTHVGLEGLGWCGYGYGYGYDHAYRSEWMHGRSNDYCVLYHILLYL